MIQSNASPELQQRFSFGYQLITWDFGPLAQLEAGLAKAAQEGFGWFEILLGDTLGGDFARRSLTLGPVPEPVFISDSEIFRRLALVADAQERHGIRPSSVYADGEWTNPQLWPTEFAKIQVLARFLAGCGAPILVCGGGPLQSDQAPATRAAYREFADKLRIIGSYTEACGIRTVYHPHLDTFVETRRQLDELMEVLDTSVVGLCIDPAHFQVKQDDPVDVFRTYASVIDYVHLKDCLGDESSLSGYDRYLGFCELGAGTIDIAAIIQILLAAEYSGVITVELDYSDTPDESCVRNAAFIRESLGLELAGGG
jgi:inosose dehydratase